MLCYNTAILSVHSINLVVGAWQKGQITWIADLWLVVGHAIILIDLAAPLIYVTSIVYASVPYYTKIKSKRKFKI